MYIANCSTHIAMSKYSYLIAILGFSSEVLSSLLSYTVLVPSPSIIISYIQVFIPCIVTSEMFFHSTCCYSTKDLENATYIIISSINASVLSL